MLCIWFNWFRCLFFFFFGKYYTVLVHWFLKCWCSVLPGPVWPLQFALIHGPNILGSFEILLFTASEFTPITRYIHNRVLFLLWLHLFILSGHISPMISSSILGTYQPREFTSQCPIFWPFHTVHGVLKARILFCPSLLQGKMLCQNSPPWPIHLGWPYAAWLIVSSS